MFSHVFLIILALPLTLVRFPQDRTLKPELYGGSLSTLPCTSTPSPKSPILVVGLTFPYNDVLINWVDTGELYFVAFANFCSVNFPTIACLEDGCVEQTACKIAEDLTVSYHELVA